MGKALYRKYRSKSLDEVVGQKHITDTLKNALSKGAISHAYLFTGPRGVGKTSIARILAHAVNELDYNDEKIHLDIIEIDAASNRRIDEIRDLRDKVHIAPTSAKYKVYIIDEVHMLTREAFNALLKTLEEPPEHVIFILATTELHKVPETIISRTQRYTFKPISTQMVVDHLRTIATKENVAIDDDALELIAEHGGGSFRDSISMLDQAAGLAKDQITEADIQLLLGVPNSELITELVGAVASSDHAAIFKTVQTIREQGVDSGRTAASISMHVRQQIIDNNLIIDHTRAVSLLKNLLPITTSSSDYLALEVALLESCNSVDSQPTATKEPTKQATPIEKNTHKEPAHAAVKEPEPQQATEAPDSSVADIVEQPEPLPEEPPTVQEQAPQVQANTGDFNQETWNAMLHDIKGKHNTFYGVLRMAKSELRDGKIVLAFSFPFHKKQIDTPQHTTLLREFVRKHFGDVDFQTVIEKTGAKIEPVINPVAPKQAPTDMIENVSNIFGGAELLES